MKKLLVWMLLALLFFPVAPFSLQVEAVNNEVDPKSEENEVEAAEKPIRILVNGESIDFDEPPFIKDGRTMVPVRFVSERLGASLAWDGEEQKVTIDLEDTRIVLVIGKDFARVDQEEIELDAPPEIAKGRTMVPLRFVGEALDADVGWDGETRTVTVDTTSTITLYFADEEAQYLVPEKREVIGVNPNNTERMSEEIFKQLLSGPTREELHPTIRDSGHKNLRRVITLELPELHLHLTDAFVNAQVGGSAAERMALYSIVNSLCEQAGVENVRFFQEDRDVEAIFGHTDTERPVWPDWNLVNP